MHTEDNNPDKTKTILEVTTTENGALKSAGQYRDSEGNPTTTNTYHLTWRNSLLSDYKVLLVSTSVGLLTGYICKWLVIGKSFNPIRRLAGNLLMIGISNYASNHPEVIRFSKLGTK